MQYYWIITIFNFKISKNMPMNLEGNKLKELKDSYFDSPELSIKLTPYFSIYLDLLGHLKDRHCTFIEVGVLNGGSLFMWRKWLGDNARIIGIDLNPDALKWQEYGFEIYIGDQGDPLFWEKTLNQIGQFDALLDDGGHQSFQQIVTLNAALKFSKKDCLVVIEDTCSSFMKDFSSHKEYSFLEYSKAATDNLTAKDCNFFQGQFPEFKNTQSLELFNRVYSIQFFSNIVAFHIKESPIERAKLIWNMTSAEQAKDFRYEGKNQAVVNWPDPKEEKRVSIEGSSKSKS